MKARIVNPNKKITPQEQRQRGKEIIESLREKGLSDYEICRKIGVPIGMDERFLNFINKNNVH